MLASSYKHCLPRKYFLSFACRRFYTLAGFYSPRPLQWCTDKRSNKPCSEEYVNTQITAIIKARETKFDG